MLYATEADFSTLIGANETLALTDLNNDGVADVGRLTACLTAASADIDGLLGGQRDTVLAKNAEFLKTACIHIARWHLSGGSVTEIDPVKERHDYYTKLLRDMADGIVGNDGVGRGAGGGAGAGHGGKADMVSSVRVFSRARRGL